MSSYLYFKKGETELCCFQRCNPTYQFFFPDKWDEWNECEERDFVYAIERCQDEIKKRKKDIQMKKDILKHLTNLDDIETIVQEQAEIREEKVMYEQALDNIFLLKDIFEYKTEDSNTHELTREKLYMMKD